MAPRGSLPRLHSRSTQHQAVRSSQTYKALRPASDYALFSRHGNVIGLIAKPGQPSPDFAPDFDAEPMVYCADGVIRRYPRPSEHEVSNYEMQVQLGFISDAPAHLVTRHFGGFAAITDHSHAAFMVHGQPVRPYEIGSFEAYPLANGRFLVPQPDFKDCSHACELMLLLDTGLLTTDVGHGYEAPDLGERRTMSGIMDSLQERTGIEPTLVEYDFSYENGYEADRTAAWRDIADMIDDAGPCILSKMGHVVMLDGVREEDGQRYLSIRDPFHGTSLECVESSEFFSTPYGGPPQDVNLKAIFLGTPGG
ncbi:hypothetical protein [Paracidovorax oryzae]|uniref:hypothetical protein n=1 Tax=Paracidovorax oryzae TaxID=862720 RepID=UPI000550E803|nr:hypothetical protein [Paracidovorax oryzae]